MISTNMYGSGTGPTQCGICNQTTSQKQLLGQGGKTNTPMYLNKATKPTNGSARHSNGAVVHRLAARHNKEVQNNERKERARKNAATGNSEPLREVEETTHSTSAGSPENEGSGWVTNE